MIPVMVRGTFVSGATPADCKDPGSSVIGTLAALEIMSDACLSVGSLK